MKQNTENKELISLDKKDRMILEHLNKNARTPLTDIAKKTGIPIDTIRYRIERMEKVGLFQYAIVVDHVKLGYPIFNEVHLELVNLSTEWEKKLFGYVKSHPNIVYGAKVAGKYDFSIAILAHDMREFDKILGEFKTAFQQIIKDYDIVLIIQEYKFDYILGLIGTPP